MIDLTKVDCLVGNGNFSQDYSEVIDSHSYVARINTLDGLGLDRGSKTDILFLSGCSNQALNPVVNNLAQQFTYRLWAEKSAFVIKNYT